MSLKEQKCKRIWRQRQAKLESTLGEVPKCGDVMETRVGGVKMKGRGNILETTRGFACQYSV